MKKHRSALLSDLPFQERQEPGQDRRIDNRKDDARDDLDEDVSEDQGKGIIAIELGIDIESQQIQTGHGES